MRRLTFLQGILVAGVLAAGCGDDFGGGLPATFVGTYDVTIAANGATDNDVMHVSLGSSQNLLLNFEAGVSQVRCVVTGPTNLVVLTQTVEVDHSTGVASGTAGGKGTIAADGTTALELDVSQAVPGGDAGAGGTTKFMIAGKRTSTH